MKQRQCVGVIDNSRGVGMIYNMKAEVIESYKVPMDEDSFVQIVIWKLPRKMPGTDHRFKYRLAYIEGDVCVIRYDNEAGKGDHRHIGNKEAEYQFRDTDTLQVDFWTDVENWRRK